MIGSVQHFYVALTLEICLFFPNFFFHCRLIKRVYLFARDTLCTQIRSLSSSLLFKKKGKKKRERYEKRRKNEGGKNVTPSTLRHGNLHRVLTIHV